MSKQNHSQSLTHSLADAFKKSKGGETLVIEAKKVISPRFNELNELAHHTWVRCVPQNQRGNHFPLFKAAKTRIRELAAQGGEDYEIALHLLKMAWVDRHHFEDAAKWFCNPLQLKELGYHY